MCQVPAAPLPTARRGGFTLRSHGRPTQGRCYMAQSVPHPMQKEPRGSDIVVPCSAPGMRDPGGNSSLSVSVGIGIQKGILRYSARPDSTDRRNYSESGLSPQFAANSAPICMRLSTRPTANAA
jgi:hypothetical protein